ncbi:RNA pseudouridine synthase [Verrucomicrobiales bacterium]|nr:RNA pseudouridine synthase [Verrucomicrobiales bacterium]MDB4662927.1 RNA pseudouridine synthase [Verrucomicrobiales bacterium]
MRLQNPNFEIIDETDDFIVVNKPAHFLVHPTSPGGPRTLFDELKDLLLFEITNGGQISIITRLDRETSGIVLVAKTAETAHQFAKAMQRHEFHKTYHAIVWEWPEEDEFTVDQPILRQRDVRESEIWVKQTVHPEGKACLTKFRVLDRFERETTNGRRFSKIECTPETGRMHQIRVHLHHAGFPIIGDKLYGPNENHYLEFIETGWTPKLRKTLLLNRQALHCAGLSWQEFQWKAKVAGEIAEFWD